MEMNEMLAKMRELQDKQQDEYIDKLYDLVENLCTKANKKSYVPTQHEKDTFNKIATIITNMQTWF